MAIESLLLAIHYQNENCHPDGRIRIGVGAGEAAWRAEVLAAAGRLFAGARAHGVPIIHIRLAVRPDYQDVILNAPVFRQWVEQSAWQEGSWGVEFLDGLRPEAGELVVTHIRNNPFYGSPLETLIAMRSPVAPDLRRRLDRLRGRIRRSGMRAIWATRWWSRRTPARPRPAPAIRTRSRPWRCSRPSARSMRSCRASPGLRSEGAAEPEAAVVVHAVSHPRGRRSLRYRLGFDEPVAAGLKRIAAEQLELAIGGFDDPALDREAAIHEARKGCKRVRSLLRLARAGLGDAVYREDNARLRDAARGLGAHRDADALLETYDKLDRHFADRIDRRRIAPVRRALAARRAQLAADAGLAAAITAFREQLEAARRRVAAWPLGDTGFEVLAAGLARGPTGAGSKAMRSAYEAPAAEHFHDWRKRVKDHRYHLELLQDLWPKPLGSWRKEVKALGSMLGDEHDLAVLQATLEAADGSFGEDSARALLDLARRRQAELRAGMRPLGARLFAERQKPLARRYRAYWRAWQSEAATGDRLAEVA